MDLSHFRKTNPSDPVTAWALWHVWFNWHLQECQRLLRGEPE